MYGGMHWKVYQSVTPFTLSDTFLIISTYFTASLPAVSDGIIQKPDSREERVDSRLEQGNTAEYG